MANKISFLGMGLLFVVSVGPLAYGKSLDIMVERLPSHMENAQISASFQINQEDPGLKRAWVELTLYQPSPSGDGPGETVTIRKQVPGLSYSPESNQVIFSEAGQAPVVCASVEESRFLFFHGTTLKATGNCVLNVAKLPVSNGTPSPASAGTPELKQDDGFFIHHDPVARVTLGIHD